MSGVPASARIAPADLIDPAARPLLTMLERMERSLETQLARQLAGFEQALAVPDWGVSRLAALLVPHLVQCADHAVMIQDRAWGRMQAKDVDTFRAARVDWARQHGTALAVNLDVQTRARIRAAIAQAARENWSPDQLRKRLQQGLVPGLPGLAPRTRAELIARTELHNAATFAQEREALGLAARGADLVKVWTATRDNRTRPTHRRAHGQTRELNQDFQVGARAMSRPGDPRGGVAEVARCRCVCRYMPRSYLPQDRQRSAASILNLARRQAGEGGNFSASVVAQAADMDPALAETVLRQARGEPGWSARAAQAAAAALEAEALAGNASATGPGLRGGP